VNWADVLAISTFMTLVSAFRIVTENAPLPDPQQLKQRALASMKQSELDLEKYSCLARQQVDELNGDGTVKRQRSQQQEQFFVNGVEIDHTLSRNGKELTREAAKKEQQRVDHEVKKYSDVAQAKKSQARDEKDVDMFLRALRFSNGRREERSGRSTIAYSLAGDRNFHPARVQERFAQALTGYIWLDEESGNVAELRVETTRDVKIGGGLLANVHKGFRLHLVQQRQPDGVWLTKAVEGSGDARAGLLFHPRFRFRQEMDECHLFSVDSHQTMHHPETGAPERAKQ